RVDRSQNDDHDCRADVDKKSFGLSGSRAANHLVREHERNCGDIKPRTGSKQAGKHENGGGRVLGRDTKPRSQIFVDRENFVIVVRLDENIADENPRQDRAEGELNVSVIPESEAFARRSEKSSGARFGGDDRSKDSPPRDAPAAEREVREIVFLPAHVKADEDDDEKIKQQNRAIDREPSIHVDPNLSMTNDECRMTKELRMLK